MIELEMREVTLGYDHQPVMESISFRVAPGELVGLIGPNGSGKSTIIRALSHIIRPRSGKILIGGQDIGRIPGGSWHVLSALSAATASAERLYRI